jgi:hypothetical protein
MRKERGNYKLPVPLSSGEIRVFSLQGNKDSVQAQNTQRTHIQHSLYSLSPNRTLYFVL